MRNDEAPPAPLKLVSEPARERETFKYDPSLLTSIRYNDGSDPVPSAELVTSPDTILTALAQLGACQTGTARSLISLFDQGYQYIVAEATPTLPLVPSLTHEERDEDLWLCGTAIPRSLGVCEFTLWGADPTDFEDGDNIYELPLALVPDLTSDNRFCAKPYCKPGAPCRFYAAVPIRTRRGINIGVYCVIDTVPRHDWDGRRTQLMRNISRSIMEYLESRRFTAANRRAERMTRGLGSFVEGKSTVSGWRSGPSAEAFADNPRLEGALNPAQQSLQREEERLAGQIPELQDPANTWPKRPQGHSAAIESSPSEPSLSQEESATHPISHSHTANPSNEISKDRSLEGLNAEHKSIADIFSKASNIIRESIEVEGCLFLNARVSTFGGLNTHRGTNEDGTQSQSSSTSSSDENKSPLLPKPSKSPCEILGFSTTSSSSIDGANAPELQSTMAEDFLSKLLRRYPRGRIFNFDANGALQSYDSSEDDRKPPMLRMNTDALDQEPAGAKSRHKNPWSRHREGSVLLKTFPGARSVAFVPVWDPKKARWCAGGFAYTETPTRIFTTEGELSYLRAFGMLAVAETFRLETQLAENAKVDALSSLSHELRSPLHGVVLGVELLNDTHLDIFQGNIMHTIETCCRTLIDTMDHLLDFSKINNYMSMMKKQKQPIATRGLRQGRIGSIEAGMKSLYSDVGLDSLAEEVLESVFAGYNFQYGSLAQLSKQREVTTHADADANRHLDSMNAVEALSPDLSERGDFNLDFGQVTVFLDIDPTCAWRFHTQPGAFRRILMNLFGNSLKYTHHGSIRVSLRQVLSTKKGRGKEKLVEIIVADTGKGISEDYLRTALFKPFSQEDHLCPGTGLGLSLVKQITTQLDGKIAVESRLGVGTTVSVLLPLVQVVPSSPTGTGMMSDEDKDFERQVAELKGLRVRLLGLGGGTHNREKTISGDLPSKDHALIENICRDWLQLEVISESEAQQMAPDLVLLAEESLPQLHFAGHNLSKAPSVVVCANAIVAYRRCASAGPSDEGLMSQFISQPIGPRKLAKILLLAFKQWVDLQSCPSTPSKGLSMSDLESFNLSQPSIPSATSEVTDAPENQSVPTAEQTEAGSATNATVSPMIAAMMSPKPTTPPQAFSSSYFPPVRLDSPHMSQTQDAGLKFLLVDDNHINLMILATYMKKLGRLYETAKDGKEAVKAYCANPDQYCCIFMDISMPVMDGFEATRRIRAYEREKQLKPASIFALSGLASESAQQEAFGSGIDLFLTKPVQLKELGTILGSRNFL